MLTTSTFLAIAPDGTEQLIPRALAEEIPIAIEVNGVGYAVLMATGVALEDLGYGFAISERLIDEPGQVLDIDAHRTADGILLRMSVAPDCAARLYDRVRHRSSDSSCGLCGIENLEQAMRPLSPLPRSTPVRTSAIFAAIAQLRDHQTLNQQTNAVHAAALCGQDGRIHLVREDVGRHNAFDKLIGAMARARRGWEDGFALLSSRCSYELVEKAVLSHCPTLVTISAPTSLAVARATLAGLHLVVLARADRILRLNADEPTA